MDRTNPQVARFAGGLTSIDDDTLAALANKGLVRRARKDIEKALPELLAADDQTVSLSMEGCTVCLTNPPGKSTCTCASGMCRHILGSIIFLRESPAILRLENAGSAAPTSEDSATATDVLPPPMPTSGPALADQLLLLDTEALQKWAGKPLFKKAAVVLSRGYEVEDSPIVLVRLPAQNVTVRLLSISPDGMICSCHAPAACEHKIAAVLAYQSHKTGRAVQLSEAILKASTGAPRSRDEVRRTVSALMRDMVTLGLSRISTVTKQRLGTLATSAHGVDLPRLERMLKTLADEVAMTLARNASASSASLLLTSSRIAAVCAGLEEPTPSLVGEHRSVYMPVAGSLDLMGLGARRWQTRSGFHGLTVLFWEPAAKRWTGWTDARPAGAPGFDPVRRFEEDGPWPGCDHPRAAAMTQWRLTGAFRNGVGRIASRANTHGIAVSLSSPEDGPVIHDFTQLSERAKQAFAPGLADHRDHSDLVLLAPEAWGDAVFDPISQEMSRAATDANGRTITLRLAHSPETDAGLTMLQRIDAASLKAVLGSLRLGLHGLFVEPITLWTDKGPLHLTFDEVSGISSTKSVITPSPTDADPENVAADEDIAEEPPVLIGSPVGQLLAQVESELLAIAEGGVEVIRDLSPLRSGARECRSLGLQTCGDAISRLCDNLDHFRKSIDRDANIPAEELLKCTYLARLAAECTTVQLAIAT